MRTNFFCTNFLNTPRGTGHPGKFPGTSQIPLRTQERQAFEGGHELFGHHPFAWKTRTPPGGLQTKNLIFVLFFLACNLHGPRAGCWDFPNLVLSNLVVCDFYAEALFAPFCALC